MIVCFAIPGFPACFREFAVARLRGKWLVYFITQDWVIPVIDFGPDATGFRFFGQP